MIDPTQPPGTIATATGNLGNAPTGIAFDGTNIWTANAGGSVSIINPQAALPYPVTTVTTGFSHPYGMLYDGANIWVTDSTAGTLLKLDATGAIIQTVTVGEEPLIPVFDGTNIWVPNYLDDSISVVQASTGKVVATILADASNNLRGPLTATFDGGRVLLTNNFGGTVTVFKAADFSFVANVTVSGAWGACSDGIDFRVTFGNNNLLRF